MPFSDQGNVANLESCLDRFDQAEAALAQRLALGGDAGDQELRSLVEKAMACRFRIQEWLAANDTVAVPRRLLKRVRSIRDGRPTPLDRAPAALREQASEEWLQNDGSTGGVLEMVWAQQEFPEVMRGEMLARAYSCGGLVLGHKPPPILTRHQRTIKDAFVVGLFDAVIVFACALIEQVATDTLMQLTPNAAIPLKPQLWETLKQLEAAMEHSEPDIQRLVREAQRVAEVRNRLLHFRRPSGMDETPAGEEDALRAIRSAFHMIEFLVRD